MEEEQESEVSSTEAENLKPTELCLGEPDFSSIYDDDELEITENDIDSKPKAKKGLKASHAINKFMPMVFSVIAKRKGQHWLLDAEEVEEFADAVDDCMEHYYPDAPELPPWAMLAFAGGSIIVPRLMLDDLSDEEKKEVEKLVNAEEQPKIQENKQKNQIPVGQGTVLAPKAVKNG